MIVQAMSTEMGLWESDRRESSSIAISNGALEKKKISWIVILRNGTY